ncbi:hypothetical protein, partial [uncultured Bilophila sp.]|uniref:hypothetical protein n=1 Tax=uncultured Bilophila sp. TaxID=529385 RepID=UPI00280B785B
SFKKKHQPYAVALPIEKKLGKNFIGSVMYVVASSPQCGENRAFFPVFPLAGSTAKAFFRLSLWSFKEKSINHFLRHSQGHQPFSKLCRQLYIIY